ncbi:putative GNAT family N-acyltransferase [Clostridium saccharoperbutylacetonicum]|uniref:GCN5-related N-acetyltransferase n=1 Tax=Clostridium saccharoperbutylacetonicum N1-4(HMT) TaxID=931276 RepID=M1MIJ0_9CLOT|nr:GNAT family N-acetyltransferase [Clostridium saccharoperbutylacetonicum]AGF56138.1 GCN5-related N-acetyltransferase [Clostridium saccharoperbutylacetonicum N1-4(HMT)]NRT63121.1 putative GNAT family N-acyltransferase [Clostridium saccharoperbutylacetonicum]NSB26479.1 putative GNAT family N-acyltransferase [Clostridium saccharoperbutylacetonicum]NSB45831.1 putative GNAT family N-acyltransferase [Clostridium saccharoperbutylacetonicum]
MITGYYISKDKSKLQMDMVKDLLKQTYWAADRPEETIIKSIQNSMCYGIFENNGTQVGFARIITDYATTYYLCDVIIDKKHRANGLGKALIEFVTNDVDLKNLRGLLLTKDAHGLYKQYGFEREREKFMQKPILL